MEVRPFPSARHAAHDLTKAEGFALGPLSVDPPARQLIASGHSEMLEPRVMQVLVALGCAGGKVLSRDDLIEQCWDGNIVGDNAINKVIFRLRHALDELSGGAVRLETIPRVGFRIVTDSPSAAGEPPRDGNASEAEPVDASTGEADVPIWSRKSTRRATTLGLVVAGGVAAIGATGWLWTKQHVPDPRAAQLYWRGQDIMKASEFESMGEAIELFRQAVAIDPDYADAWGALALSHRYPALGRNLPLSHPHQVRVAAERALALVPDNADARLALILLYPWYRRWLEREAQLGAFLRDHPDSALGHALLAHQLFEVGRLDESLTMSLRAIEISPMLKVGWIERVMVLSYAGRNGEADLAVEEARSRWPRDIGIWLLGRMVLTDSGRHAEAVAYLRDAARRPDTVTPYGLEMQIRSSEALATGQGIAEAKKTIRDVPAALLVEVLSGSASDMAQFGMTDEMFALFEAHYFGGVVNNTRIPPPGPLDNRFSCTLFSPPVLTLSGDPRYASLLERTGLEDYWRKSGTIPDFRR